MKKILTVSLGALLIATAANADIASVEYVTDGLRVKQDTISDLDTIRSGAELGATAVQDLGDLGITATATELNYVDGVTSNIQTQLSTVKSTADTAKADAATAQTTANNALTKANAAVVANDAITAKTGTKITYDSKGLVTGSASLAESDIPTLSIGKVSGLQTALDGKQATLTIDSELNKTSTNPVQNKVVAEELAGKQNASTAVEVTTAGTAVGSSTVPVYVNASGVVAPITSYAGNAATATKATEDASGNVITTTYATKTELAGKQDKLTIDSALNTGSTNPVQNMAVAKALNEKQAALGYTPENSANKVTTATGLTASSTDAQYPSAKLVYTAVNGKQDTLTTSNIKGSNGVSVGISNGVITVTGTTYSTGTESKSGLTKLYPDIGVNTDGTMTQSAIKAALGTKQDTIDDLGAIRSGATLGASAVQPATLGNYATKTELAGKQDKLVDGENIEASNGVAIEQGQDGKLTIKGTGASSTDPGVLKLHNDVTGNDVDGTVTQYAIKTALDGKLSTSGTAAKATADASGQTITTTYATKTELTTGLNRKQDLVANGTDGNFYVADYRSAWGDMFTLMPKDPECNNTDIKCALTHKNGKYGWEIVRE